MTTEQQEEKVALDEVSACLYLVLLISQNISDVP